MRMPKLFVFIILSLSVARASLADPVRVTGGSFGITVEGDRFAFRGDGFELISNLPHETIPKVLTPVCVECRAGDVIEYSFTTLGEQVAGMGRAEFMGATYPEVFYLAELSFKSTPREFPDVTGPGVSFRQPFTFEGAVRAFTDAQFTNLAFATELRGFGLAGNFFFNSGPGTYTPDEPGTGVWVFSDAQPVPEPATLLLLGGGIAGLMLRRRARISA